MDGLEEVRRLAQNLGGIAAGAFDDVDAVNKKGALNIKNEMIADVSSSPHFHGMAGSITFEHENGPGVIRRVIGPDKGRRGGALGNIYYFGTSRGGGSGDIDKPLRSEEPRYVSELERLAARWAGQL
ncbi:hypothetical protein ACIPY0_20215 [Paenarthrobacter nicotinovorans]|uniref:hypothetical protein n=1 Tax=Paenarthrobacter nicotinovorans TaxID=29320 RepID=UPI00382F27C3